MMYDGKADNLIRDGVVMKIDLRAKDEPGLRLSSSGPVSRH